MTTNNTTQGNPFHFIPNLVDENLDIPTNSILSRTIYSDPQIKVILFGFAAGQELSEHTASVPAILHILSGDIKLTLGDQTFSAQAGAWAHMDAKLPHSVLAKSQAQMLLVMLLSAP